MTLKRAGTAGQLPAGVRIRPLSRQDVVELRDALASGAVAGTTRRFFPRSLPSMLDWYDHLQSSRDISPFAIAIDALFVGYCALRPPVYSGRELAIAIFDPRYHGKGVGTFAVQELCAFGFGRLRLSRIELTVYPTHRRAISCYERCGFREEASLRQFIYHEGEWVDLMLMSLLRSEWQQSKRRFS